MQNHTIFQENQVVCSSIHARLTVVRHKQEQSAIRTLIFFIVVIIFFFFKLVKKSAPPPDVDSRGGPDEFLRKQEEEKKRELLKKYSAQTTARPVKPENLLSSPHAGRRILVADDSRTIQHSISMVLEPEGFNVMTASDDSALWRQVADQVPDLVLIDYQLGSAGGYNLCEQLRQNGPTRNIPVIILCGPTISGDVERVNSCGAVGFLSKPFESQQLIDLVNSSIDITPVVPTCPVCETAIEQAGQFCPSCGGLHHHECWHLNDGCGRCDYRVE